MNVNKISAAAVRDEIDAAVRQLHVLPAEEWRVPLAINELTIVATPPAPDTVGDVRIYRKVGKRETERDLSRLANVFNPRMSKYVRLLSILNELYARTRYHIFGDKHTQNLFGELNAVIYLANISQEWVDCFSSGVRCLRAPAINLLADQGWMRPRTMTARDAVLGWAAARRALDYVNSGAWQPPKGERGRPQDLRALGVARSAAHHYRHLTGREATLSHIWFPEYEKQFPGGPFYEFLSKILNAAALGDADVEHIIKSLK